MTMNSKHQNNMDYDCLNVDYDSDYSSCEEKKNINPADLHSNDLFESESFLGCYADSYLESNVLSAEEKYQNWIYSDTDVSIKKKINYPFPMLATGEVFTPSKFKLYKHKQQQLALIEDKIVFLQKEIEKHDRQYIELSLLHNLPKYSALTIIRMEKMKKQKEEEDKIEKEKRDLYMRNMMIENAKNKKFNASKVFSSNVKTISEEVIKQRRAIKKIESKNKKMEDKNKEELVSMKLKEDNMKAAQIKKEEEEHKKQEYIEKIKQDVLSNNELTTLNDRLIVLQLLNCVKDIEVTEEVAKEEKIKKKKYMHEKVNGWEITMDRKKEMNIRREKVKFLCDSILKNKPCRHGINCNFSHVVTECPFGIKCMNVVCDEGTYSNRIGERTKVCTFIHKGESVFNFNLRVGIEAKKEESKKEVKCIKKEVIKMYIVTGINVNDGLASLLGTSLGENTWVNIVSKGIKRDTKSTNTASSMKLEENLPMSQMCGEMKLESCEEIVKVDLGEAAKGDTSCALRGDTKCALRGEKRQTVNKILTKTQMCSSVVNNIPCRHGSKCRFAHDKYELTCSFGENCRNIEKKNNLYVNVQINNYCSRLHPGETIDALKERLGIQTIKTDQQMQAQQMQAQQMQDKKEQEQAQQMQAQKMQARKEQEHAQQMQEQYMQAQKEQEQDRQMQAQYMQEQQAQYMQTQQAQYMQTHQNYNMQAQSYQMQGQQAYNNIQMQAQQMQAHQARQAYNMQMQAQQMQACPAQDNQKMHKGWIDAKVKLCMYIGRCRDGASCKYAHSREEIECGYGNSCKNVCWDGCKYINTSNVKCDRRHPYESAEGVKWRCNNK